MVQYVLRRLLWMIPTPFGITFLIFSIMQLAPGDPAELKFAGASFSGEGASDSGNIEAAIEKFRRENLLDRPIWIQYFHYLGPFDLSPRGHEAFGGTGESPWGGLVLGDLKREFLRPNVEIRDELLEPWAEDRAVELAEEAMPPSDRGPAARLRLHGIAARYRQTANEQIDRRVPAHRRDEARLQLDDDVEDALERGGPRVIVTRAPARRWR